jgi:type II secretory pathway pseudopilin PulG
MRPRQAHRQPRRQRGAALLLLVAVLGLGAASLLISAFGRNTGEAERQQRTLATLAQAREALLGFAATQGRLPRPAASALDGRERAADCADDAACSGFVPWVALGVDGVDAWGKLLRYSVTPEMARAPIVSFSAVANRVVLERGAQGEFAFVAGQALCDVSAQCLPVVLFSQGKNHYGTAASGVTQINTARGNIDEAANDRASRSFIARPATNNAVLPGGAFDDMLTWIPLPTLYQRMRAARNLP